jgi:minor extracellular serine protease Vpr
MARPCDPGRPSTWEAECRLRCGCGSALATTKTTPVVTLGSESLTVNFAGLAPGFVGLYQLDVSIPQGASTGTAVPLSISISGVVSNTATIAVQ